MEKKVKKHVEILEELKRRRKGNDQFCQMNDCRASDYMKGSNKIIDDMIEFIEKL